jgi:hypothetical protein
MCKSNFISHLKMNAEYNETCNECRHKIRFQGRKYKNDDKQWISDLKQTFIKTFWTA